MVHRETTSQIIGAAFEVHNTPGYGFWNIGAGMKVGMLVNFGRERVPYKVMIL